MTEPLIFEEWWESLTKAQQDSASIIRMAYAAGVASQQAGIETLERAFKPKEEANQAMVAQLAEKDAEIEHLHKALSLAEMGRQVSVPFARYEAVVEVAREIDSRERRNEALSSYGLRHPLSLAYDRLRAALAALDEA